VAWVVAVAVLGLVPDRGLAGFTLQATPTQASVVAGGSTQILIELVQDVGDPLTRVAGFSFRMDIDPTAGVRFTGGAAPATNYLFAGHSSGFAANPIDPVTGNTLSGFPATSIAASDIYDVVDDGAPVRSGERWAIALLDVAVDPTATPGANVPIRFNQGPSVTIDLYDREQQQYQTLNAADLMFSDTSIDVLPPSVPVPAPPAAVLFGLGVVGFAAVGRWNRRRAAPPLAG
jgi:hypothetical protein